ncbi:hypothetical protein Prudu_018147 [Prunus dulcis]|uniref:Uncharacterized protein n=1 Tax=Prunus dulcis TaxID=3755 RepID=A0A4Y1RRW1_PRUDU|nr:hypothetical protein Prudu_018147 [Prunus dulcis]
MSCSQILFAGSTRPTRSSPTFSPSSPPPPSSPVAASTSSTWDLSKKIYTDKLSFVTKLGLGPNLQALVVHISHQPRLRDQNKIASAGINLKVQRSGPFQIFNGGLSNDNMQQVASMSVGVFTKGSESNFNGNFSHPVQLGAFPM